MTVSGVKDVDRFDEETVEVFTELGKLTVRGEGLHIDRLSTESGELTVLGHIHLLAYTDDRPKSGGWKRLFR